MNEKEVWLSIMEFIHDEKLNCDNFAELLRGTWITKKEDKAIALLMDQYLQTRSELGDKVKLLVDLILQGERKEK